MKTSTQQWIDFAKADLKNCRQILSDDTLTNIVAFHSQQAVEKSFKALIEEKNLNIPRIHNLIRLYNVIESFFELPIETRELLALDNVYTSSRYPSDIGMIASGVPTQQEAKDLFESAENIFQIVMQIIKNE